MTRRIMVPFAGLAALAILWVPAVGEDAPAVKPKDLTKTIFESPTKNVIAGKVPNPPPVRRADVGKGRIEIPLKGLLADQQPPLPPPQPPLPPPRPEIDRGKADIEVPVKRVVHNAAPAKDAGFENPKVEPGLVSWNADLAAACEAAKKSGKPVLLFQMMGRLDDRFC